MSKSVLTVIDLLGCVCVFAKYMKQGDDNFGVDTVIHRLASALTVFTLASSGLRLRGFLPKYNCLGVMSWKKGQRKGEKQERERKL